jgi:hypothetical protein
MTDRDAGVPGALSQAVRELGERIPPSQLDRLWLFPPRTRGRSESGVVAGSCYVEGDRRLLVTLAYRAEESGTGVSFRPVFQEEGEAPEDRLPKIMDGVVQRSEEAREPARMVWIAGDPAAFADLIAELAALRGVAGMPSPRE